MEKNQRTLKISLISAKDLQRVQLLNKMEVCAYVFISGGGKQKTAVDRDGDTNLTWNGQITFNLDKESAETQVLVFELNCCDQNGKDKVIGEVFVKVKALMGSIEGSLTFLVRSPSGNPNGTLNFMFEWEDEKVAGAGSSPPPPAMVQVQEQAEPAKKKKRGWFARVLAAAAISHVLNNVSLPDDLGF
ncbi:uncharacterized protein LOC114285217 [Camellia sinensis]|uniref:uncharacterized protein LOC114285217 n=1 Tax=Camellia sinensis TaxID=4442 RepID=UPI001035F0C9|nr:uncharacterized protein LOC114285217 [Camellia sinensis]